MKNHFLILTFLLVSACSREPKSELMRKMEQSGAGDVRSATSQSIEQWFVRNPEVALDICKKCGPLRTNAPAKWGDTTDGRICAAAARANAFYYLIHPVGRVRF
jgi:hypothetical protein